jgi:hypothetical protein
MRLLTLVSWSAFILPCHEYHFGAYGSDDESCQDVLPARLELKMTSFAIGGTVVRMLPDAAFVCTMVVSRTRTLGRLSSAPQTGCSSPFYEKQDKPLRTASRHGTDVRVSNRVLCGFEGRKKHRVAFETTPPVHQGLGDGFVGGDLVLPSFNKAQVKIPDWFVDVATSASECQPRVLKADGDQRP